jgi:hypothetical protein
LYFQLTLSVLGTKEIGFGLYATPNTMDSLPAKSPEALKHEAEVARPNRSKPANLRDQVSNLHLWPTPDASQRGTRAMDLVINQSTVIRRTSNQKRGIDLQTAVKIYPTVRASEYKDCGPVGSKSQIHMDKRDYLCAKVKESGNPTGTLNPQWVEWLMGLPIGYTDLKCSETAKSLLARM